MTTPATPSERKNADITPSHEDRLRQIWERYGSLLYLICGVAAAAILAKGGWDYVNAQKELGIQKEFAGCVSMDSFRNFAANHPGHPLTGVAEVTVADNAYAADRYAEAVTAYTSAVADLPGSPVQARAKLGLAMSLAFGGKNAEAEANLRQLLNDTSLLKTVRCEAGYHLAVLAVAAGRGSEVQKLAEQLMQIDPSSPFAARTFTLRSRVSEATTMPAVLPAGVPAKP